MIGPHIPSATHTTYSCITKASSTAACHPPFNAVYISLVDLPDICSGPRKRHEMPKLIAKYNGCLILAKQALALFRHGDLSLMDPVVGENMCQIRSVMLLEILNYDSIHDEVKSFLKQIKRTQEKLSDSKNLLREFKEGTSFHDFARSKDIALDITEQLTFIISAYILTLSKIITYKVGEFGTPEREDKTTPKLLCTHRLFGTNFANDLIKKLQVLLSKMSVNFVQNLGLRALFRGKENELRELVSEKYIHHDVKNRLILPFYAATKIVMHRWKQSRFVVMRVHQYITHHAVPYGVVNLIYRTNKQGEFELFDECPTVHTFRKGVLIVEMNSITPVELTKKTLINKMKNLGVEQIFALNSASHPQYAMEHPEPLGRMCQEEREKAEKLGACNTNPLMLIEHVITGNSAQYRVHSKVEEKIFIKSNATIKDLYKNISIQSEIPRYNILLIYKGKVLIKTSLDTIQDSGLISGSPLFVTTHKTLLFTNRRFVVTIV